MIERTYEMLTERGGIETPAPVKMWTRGVPVEESAMKQLANVAATLVLTGVAVLAALLSIWGFATLREHAGTIAKEAAEKAMPKAAEAAAERAVRKLLDLPEGEGSNEIARAYGSENNGN